MGKKYAKKLKKIARALKSFQSPDWERIPEKVEAKILEVKKMPGKELLTIITDLGKVTISGKYKDLVNKGKEVYLLPAKGILRINQHEIPTLKIPQLKEIGEMLPGEGFRPEG